MWEFLSNVLEKGGVVATLFFLLAIACGVAIRALWNKNQALHKQLLAAARAQETMGKAHALALTTMAERHADEKRAQADEFTGQLMKLTRRIDELQERRVSETRTVTEKVVSYIGHIDNFANKLEATIDILLRASERR